MFSDGTDDVPHRFAAVDKVVHNQVFLDLEIGTIAFNGTAVAFFVFLPHVDEGNLVFDSEMEGNSCTRTSTKGHSFKSKFLLELLDCDSGFSDCS